MAIIEIIGLSFVGILGVMVLVFIIQYASGKRWSNSNERGGETPSKPGAKTSSGGIIFLALLIGLYATNPEREKHEKAIKGEIREQARSKGGLGSIGAEIGLTDAAVSLAGVGYKNFYFFSVGRMGGEIASIGFFAKVITIDW